MRDRVSDGTLAARVWYTRGIDAQGRNYVGVWASYYGSALPQILEASETEAGCVRIYEGAYHYAAVLERVEVNEERNAARRRAAQAA